MYIDLKRKSYKSNNRWLIKDGKTVGDFALPDSPITLADIATLYANYKYSYPNPKIQSTYFKALSANELSMHQMVNGQTRNQAKNELEKTLLFAILRGDIQWPDENMWFWQPLEDKDFVLLKDWFITSVNEPVIIK